MKLTVKGLKSKGACMSAIDSFVAEFRYYEAVEEGVRINYNNLIRARSCGLEWYFLISFFPIEKALEFILFVIERNYETLVPCSVNHPDNMCGDCRRREYLFDTMLSLYEEHGIGGVVDWYRRRINSFRPVSLYDDIVTYDAMDAYIIKYFECPTSRGIDLYYAVSQVADNCPSVAVADEAFEKFYTLLEEMGVVDNIVSIR